MAFISDLHGNLPALEAVLADLGTADAVVCCGDLVGYYPDVVEVVERIQDLGVRCVRGNHELMATGARPIPPDRAGYYRIDLATTLLSPDQLAWLAALPAALTIEHGGLTVEVRHASPWDEETYLYPDSPALAGLALPAGRLVVLGHTHHPMHVRAGEGAVANPGSVGQPRDRDPRASYAVLDTSRGRWEQRRVSWDHRRYQRRLEGLGFHPLAIELLGRTRAEGVR